MEEKAQVTVVDVAALVVEVSARRASRARGPFDTGPPIHETAPATVPAAADGCRVLVVAAHPDDVDFGAAGTVARFVEEGAGVSYCIVTDGDAGGYDRNVARGEMASLRREEQRAAALEVGVHDVVYLGYPDGRLTVTLDLRRDLSRVIRQVRPDIVITQCPERNYERIPASHPDHMAAGEAALCAIYPDARNPFAHPELMEEGLEPHIVSETWLMASASPTGAVDVTGSFGRKVAALKRHESQVGDGSWLEGTLKEWMARGAEVAGLVAGSLAEIFQVVHTG